MHKNRIFLFGMDGTLTHPEEAFHWTLESSLKELMYYGEIGIITSADYETIEQKMNKFINYSSTRYHLHILPCNGTQWYPPPVYHDREVVKKYGISMENHLGYEDFQKLMKLIVDYQSIVTDDENIKMKGTFVYNQGSLINWCPIGRSSNKAERQFFESYDDTVGFRENLIKTFRKSLGLCSFGNKLQVRLSGTTSLNIFPVGWDKTFALNHFPEFEPWFVGNSCEEGEEDKEIYDACSDRSYKTTSPIATVDIIYDIIARIESKK